jgi:5'-nucleotidase
LAGARLSRQSEVVRILVTNDDGIDSVGLHVLARAMRRLGEVIVVAPDSEYSGASAALGALQQMKPEVHRTSLDGIDEAWAVGGPPALCVMFARLGAFGRKPDLVVAGINPGANVGRSVYHSGTIGAALTARTGGISGVAISQAVTGFGVEGQGWDEMLADQRWDVAAEVAVSVVGALTADPPPEPIVVNVNVPNLPLDRIRGWRQTTVGVLPPRAMATAVLEPKLGHDGSFSVNMSWGEEVALPAGTDGGAIERDEVSITFLGPLAGIRVPVEVSAAAALDGLLGRTP